MVAEKAGSGTLDMIARCSEAGLPAPVFRQDGGQFVQMLPMPPGTPTPEVTPEARLAGVLVGEMRRQQLQQALGLKDDDHFRKAYLQPALGPSPKASGKPAKEDIKRTNETRRKPDGGRRRVKITASRHVASGSTTPSLARS